MNNDSIIAMLDFDFSPNITVKKNGWLTGYIQVSRYVKQRCIRTNMYFLYRDAFRKIKIDTNIKGIKLNSFLQTENIVEYRTIQYADDVVLIMKDEESQDNALKITQT